MTADGQTKPAGIIVIADDLSGAAELANAAVQAGFSAEVQMRFWAGSDADVICVDTETRSLPPEAAGTLAGNVARSIAMTDPELVYKKCDSVLRGPIAAESLAIARALGRKRVLLIPANPSRHRVIRGGEYFVDGTPLAQTAFATDPDYPRRTSRVVDLLGSTSGIETPDVVSAVDVSSQAATVNAGTLPVGAVDFSTRFWQPKYVSPGQRRMQRATQCRRKDRPCLCAGAIPRGYPAGTSNVRNTESRFAPCPGDCSRRNCARIFWRVGRRLPQVYCANGARCCWLSEERSPCPG